VLKSMLSAAYGRPRRTGQIVGHGPCCGEQKGGTA
jgi:hypothetical protein